MRHAKTSKHFLSSWIIPTSGEFADLMACPQKSPTLVKQRACWTMSIILPEIDLNPSDQATRKMTIETHQEPRKSNDDCYKDHLPNIDSAILHIRKVELNQRRGLSCDEKVETRSAASSNFGHLELGSTYQWSDSSSLSDPSSDSV